MPLEDRSFLEFCTDSEPSKCGYCKGKRGGGVEKGKLNCGEGSSGDTEEPFEGSITTGVWAHNLTCQNYMQLLDMGWRRSGRYLYKPQNESTCCPQYTIRLDVNKFQMSRSQKRVMRQMNEYLATGKKPRSAVRDEMDVEQKSAGNAKSVTMDEEEETKKENVKDADRPVIKKKEMRRKRFEEKCREKNIDPEEVRRQRIAKEEGRRRTIQSFLGNEKADWKHHLETKLVRVDTEEFGTTQDESFEVYKKYQMTIHKDTECRFASFRRFLCDSPLKDCDEEIFSSPYGSFHLQFILDGKIIAVSVVDILPRCLSAKYMFYDPDYPFLSMGTYTALRELDELRKLHESYPELKYYYMGYYIESCPKMRYKSKFRPSDLLCDQSFQWMTFDSCHKLLEKSEMPNGYAVFYPNIQPPTPFAIQNMIVYTKDGILLLAKFLERNKDVLSDGQFLGKVERLAQKIGKPLPNCIYYFKELQ